MAVHPNFDVALLGVAESSARAAAGPRVKVGPGARNTPCGASGATSASIRLTDFAASAYARSTASSSARTTRRSRCAAALASPPSPLALLVDPAPGRETRGAVEESAEHAATAAARLSTKMRRYIVRRSRLRDGCQRIFRETPDCAMWDDRAQRAGDDTQCAPPTWDLEVSAARPGAATGRDRAFRYRIARYGMNNVRCTTVTSPVCAVTTSAVRVGSVTPVVAGTP